MRIEDLPRIIVEQKALASRHLNRYVIVDFYLPKNIEDPESLSLLLINDGQNLDELKFSRMINHLLETADIQPLVCVGIHAGKDRKNEYGTASVPDYAGRGARAGHYQQFIMTELLPFIHAHYRIGAFRQKAFAGFSLGGLSALDTVWHHPDIFSIAGIFSGSLWWRSKSLEDNYNDETDRIMHELVRQGSYAPELRFYFTTGSMDETADRNNNGIIDSIDDTLDLVKELKRHGYGSDFELKYLNYEDGRHDMETWARAMPDFLRWAFREEEFVV